MLNKILLISPCGLPVPAVKGGAVATLIESLIKENENNETIKLTVVSSFFEKAKEESYKYKNTNFIFIKITKSINFKYLHLLSNFTTDKLITIKFNHSYFNIILYSLNIY